MTHSLYFSFAKIVEMSSWMFFPGWTASSCGTCRAKVNVGGGCGFFCPCGHYNVLPWSGFQIPHEKPDHGPAMRTLRLAWMVAGQLRQSNKLTKLYRGCPHVRRI